nr:TPA_asm: hypothetical protein HUJ06_003488 [Nelumbo nucifera]
MGTVPAHHLDALANEDCWSLFKQCAFVDDTDLNSHPNLEAIGKEIVKKCKGVPLAAKTLGGHLRSKVNEDEWRYILTSEILELGNENGILLALRLSYQHLPAHLKRCFAYCSIFPKDYRFRKERLVWLWMAEGFIHSARGKQLEDIGGKYFDDLFLRSFFQYDNCDKSTFVMHDLIHDLANSISKDICFRTEFDDEIKNVPKKARHLSFLPVSYEPVKLDALYNAKSLHTFLLPDTSKDAYRHSFQQLSLSTQRWQQLHNLFLALGCLRVLCLHSFPICVLPNSIGNLKLLRFLDLSYTGIERLPKSICTLYHLQALILDGVVLHKLPKNLSNLISLRLIRMTYKGKTGHGIRKKISLQAQGLWRNRGSSPGNLKNLNYFDGNLYISSLQNMVNVIDAKDGNLEDKKNIHDLLLEWHCAGRKERAAIEEIIESLQPYVNLKGLRIQGYHSLRFPNWMAQVSNLLQVEFSNCSRTQTLPPLGELPLLKYLKIEHMDSIKHIGCEFYGGRNATIFPSLKTLIFNDMPAWEEWSCGVVNIDQEKSEDLFPCLSRLEIKICPKLKGLHFNRFPALKKLNIYLCDVLTAITKLQIPSYTGWSDGDLRKESSSSSSSLVERIEFPCLRDLSIQFCSKLRSLPPLFPSLVYLEITNCNELANLPRLPSLIRIHVNSKLICIPEEFLKPLTALEELKICSSVNLVALGNKVGGSQHLQILRHLEICGCHNLEILPQLHNLNFLIYLKIDDAPKLESFPEMGLPTNLQKFKIKRCEKMESLPEQMHSLTCLEKLSIQSCPCIMFFPQGGLPTNLRRLKISGCGEKNEEILPKCIGLHKLTSLEELTMKQCSGLMSFPRDEWLLPTSLTRLRLYNFERLECLPPSWFQQLNALVSLEINDAPRLKSLPEEGLPPTLQKLEIYHCPLLEESCRKDQGRDWHKIAHISNINIY